MVQIGVKIGHALILLLIITGSSWAGNYDMNPGRECLKYRHDLGSDVTGNGYAMEYMKVNTNNLSMLEYAHGSGGMDFADILYSGQKTTSKKIYWMDYNTGEWKKGDAGPSSAITYIRQYDNVQSPTAFAYGTGWYASHPVTYNSLIKDKNQAKSYQEAASMHRQVEYARALKGDIAIELNCIPNTATADGTGSISMRLDDEVTQGTLHIGELLAHPMKDKYTPKYAKKQGWKDPIIEIDTDYIGDFQVQKAMKLTFVKYAPTWGEDWLPCCMGGFFDIPSYNFDKERGSQKGIFDCSCRNTSISTMKPAWNTSEAQFPTAIYQKKP